MKTSIRSGALSGLILAAAIAAPTTLRAEAAATIIEIPFTPNLTAPDLKIERLSAEVVGERARFTLHYSTEVERFLSFFDPPQGTTIRVMERGALKRGAGLATFMVPLAKLRAVPAITMRFSGGDDADRDRNFILLNLNAPGAAAIFGDRKAGRVGGARERTIPSFAETGPVNEVATYADIRWKDASGVAGLDAEKITGLRFNEATRWNAKDAAVSREILEHGKNPGLGVRQLHRAGITGAGVSVGIIDQNIHPNHPEFKERLARYKDVGCNATNGSMHGPAVASLLVGKTIGTAPGARLYFAAAPSWTKDAKFQAEALDWLLEINATLPSAEKIRVISVSAAPSGAGSPFTKNNELWDAACDRATKAGVLVLDCTSHRGFIASCYLDPSAPDDFTRVSPGYPGTKWEPRVDRILAPASRRTVAEEYIAGVCEHQYTGRGGLSWSIPYVAGVFALGWQVNPQLPPERMVELLRQTAFAKEGAKIINPAAFIAAVKRP